MKDQLKVIKQKPNPALILELETMLAQAKKGELKGLLYAKVWDDDETSHGWIIPRISQWKISALIGEVMMSITELSNNKDGIDSRIINY